MKIEVKNCKDCPFVEFDKVNASCLAPKQIHTGRYNIDSYYKNYKSPNWCPLKKVDNLIISHKIKGGIKLNLKTLTKKQVEANRSSAYKYIL